MVEYLYGETVRITNTFTDVDDVLYDPDTIELKIYDPTGAIKTTVTYAAGEIIKSAVGIYYYDYTIPSDATTQGYWQNVWQVISGAFGDVSESQFYARSSGEKLYASVNEVKDNLMASGMTMSDDTVRNVIRSAMGEVEIITGRKFTPNNVITEWFNTDQRNPNTVVNAIVLNNLPVQSVTSLKEFDTSKDLITEYEATDYWCESDGMLELTMGSFMHQRHRIECVYMQGYDMVPVAISKLTSVIAQLEVMRHSMIAADADMTSFSIPEIGDVQLGEVYVTAVRAIEQLNKQKKLLMEEIGNLRNDIYVV